MSPYHIQMGRFNVNCSQQILVFTSNKAHSGAIVIARFQTLICPSQMIFEHRKQQCLVLEEVKPHIKYKVYSSSTFGVFISLHSLNFLENNMIFTLIKENSCTLLSMELLCFSRLQITHPGVTYTNTSCIHIQQIPVAFGMKEGPIYHKKQFSLLQLKENIHHV